MQWNTILVEVCHCCLQERMWGCMMDDGWKIRRWQTLLGECQKEKVWTPYNSLGWSTDIHTYGNCGVHIVIHCQFGFWVQRRMDWRRTNNIYWIGGFPLSGLSLNSILLLEEVLSNSTLGIDNPWYSSCYNFEGVESVMDWTKKQTSQVFGVTYVSPVIFFWKFDQGFAESLSIFVCWNFESMGRRVTVIISTNNYFQLCRCIYVPKLPHLARIPERGRCQLCQWRVNEYQSGLTKCQSWLTMAVSK
jgi:hypothetical protein